MVPLDSVLKPADIGAGERFRLMFISSTTRDATSTDIADYNTWVSTRAAAGVTAIQAYAGDFTALVSTESVNARANTQTRATDTDAPIYWVDRHYRCGTNGWPMATRTSMTGHGKTPVAFQSPGP